MRIIPVIDLKAGVVVRAVGGKRETYQPVRSVLSSDASPVSIAAGLAERLGAREVYVADLDAIAGDEPAWDLYQKIASAGLRLWVDAGVGSVERARQLVGYQWRGMRLDRVIVGLESISDATALAAIARHVDIERLAFSLDLFHGQPLNASPVWYGGSSMHAARFAVEVGMKHIIVLDLARVGKGEGTGTESLCGQLHQAHPSVELIAGGGISDLQQIEGLLKVGCGAVLVSSALHDGRLTAEQLQEARLL